GSPPHVCVQGRGGVLRSSHAHQKAPSGPILQSGDGEALGAPGSMPKRPIKPRWFPSPQWARGTRRWRPRPAKRGGRSPPSLGVDRLTFFVPGSVELGLQACGVLFVIVLCVDCVLAVAAGREVAVGRRAGRAGSRIPQLGAYEGLRAVIKGLLDRDPPDDAGQLA